jgi:hypothetical protein
MRISRGKWVEKEVGNRSRSIRKKDWLQGNRKRFKLRKKRVSLDQRRDR